MQGKTVTQSEKAERFAALHRGLGLHYMLAQVLTTGLLVLPGYALSRGWVFR